MDLDHGYNPRLVFFKNKGFQSFSGKNTGFVEIIIIFTLPDWTEAELLSLEMELTRAEPLLPLRPASPGLLVLSLASLVSPPSSWIFMECSLKMAFSRRFSSSNFSKMILS